MRSLRFGLGAMLVIAASVVSLGVAQPCQGQVLVNEILADPGFDWDGDGAVSSRDDEWVEIVNAGLVPVDLSSYLLSDGGTSRLLRFGFSGTLAPGGVKLVTGGTSVAWESANGESATGLSLNNTGDTVRLWQVVGTDTLLVDSYTYVGFEVLDDRSTARMPDGAPTWALFDARNPYAGTTPPLGTGCPPTPGTSNVCPTAVTPVGWGAVKSLYAPPDARR